MGKRVKVTVPEIAGGNGTMTAFKATINRKPATGKRYVLARCKNGRLKARGQVNWIALKDRPAPSVKQARVDIVRKCKTKRESGGGQQVKRPRVKARSPQRQRGKRVKIKIRAGAAERVKVGARARIKIQNVKRAFKAKAGAKRAKAGKLAKLTLKAKGKRITRELRRHRRGTATVAVTLTDPAGHRTTIKRRVALRR